MWRARIAGHPLHPALVHFPIALWLAATLWDGIGWWRSDPLWWQMSHWCLALGLAMALPTLITGLLDYVALKPNARIVGVATAHMMVMVSATIIFATCWLLHVAAGAAVAPSPWVLVLELSGAVLLAVGGWLGGILVYRYRIGADGS